MDLNDVDNLRANFATNLFRNRTTGLYYLRTVINGVDQPGRYIMSASNYLRYMEGNYYYFISHIKRNF